MRSKLIFSWDRIHEIEFFLTFHEIKIPNNYSISWSRHFSWDQNSQKALLGNFDLMIDLLAASAIMRSKFLIMLFWISISWSKIQPPDQNCQILINKFELMNQLNFDLMIKNLISWKSWILISWNLTSWLFPIHTAFWHTSKLWCYLWIPQKPVGWGLDVRLGKFIENVFGKAIHHW